MINQDYGKLLDFVLKKINESSSTQASGHEPRELILIEKGKEYERRRIERIIEKRNKEITLRPVENASCGEKSEKVEDRLIRLGLARDVKIEKIREKKKEVGGITAPTLPSRQQSSEFLNRLEKFKLAYAKNLEKKRVLQMENENSQVKSPKINKNSKKIVEKLGVSGKVEERLIGFGELYKEKQNLMQTAKDLYEICSAVPRISPLAQRMRRTGDVVDRLSGYSEIYEENLQVLNEKYYKNKQRSIERRDPAAFERLTRTKSCNLQAKKYSFTPKISGISRRIAKKLGKSFERLCQPAKKGGMGIEDSECFFYPQINKSKSSVTPT